MRRMAASLIIREPASQLDVTFADAIFAAFDISNVLAELSKRTYRRFSIRSLLLACFCPVTLDC
jgi:hypothetical protein